MILARELSRSLAGLTWTWGISSFAGAKSIGLYGNEEQKQRFLPELAEGKLKFSIAFTEPSGGTDLLGAMKTTGTKVDGGWRITGQKIWSTAAHVADYLLLLARSDKDVTKKTQGTTLFLSRPTPRASPPARSRSSACAASARARSSSTTSSCPTTSCSASPARPGTCCSAR